MSGLRRLSLEDRFWAKVSKADDTSCWLWTAGRSKATGYGKFGLGGKMVNAHRLAYELSKGPIPEGLFVLHSCDDKLCMNPLHLRVGTHAQNMVDMTSRGRSTASERHGMVKLTQQQVEEIRKLWALGNTTQKAIALRYKVSRARICNILNQKSWKESAK